MHADQTAATLITLGAIFLASLSADVLGRRTRLPRVTLLLLLGVAVGPLGLELLPAEGADWFPFITDLALLMVAFLLGGELRLSVLRQHGRAVVAISLLVVVATLLVVAGGLLALGWPVEVALPLAAIATSTDPVAVSDVARELRARGPFTKVLLGIVAIDDAWGIAALSLVLALVLGLQSPESAGGAVLEGVVDLFGAIVLGVVLGLPLALLTGRVRDGEPTQAEALGAVLLCGGVARLLDVSFLLAAMTMGVILANVARHHRRPFRAIEGIEWPFMVLFFVLSGAALDARVLGEASLLAAAYIALRIAGRVLGGWLGVRVADGLRPSAHAHIGAALLPQAGVAIGIALVVAERVPDVGSTVLSVTVAATVFFEAIGPLLTRRALLRSGDGAEGAPAAD